MTTDICFCDNKSCKKRKQCLRAIENHNRDDLPKYNYFASFKCFQEGEQEFFIRKKDYNYMEEILKKYGRNNHDT